MDARDHIMGSSSAGYSFLQINQSVMGQIITEPKVTQQRNFHDGQPAFWPSGDPKWQTVFQVQTQLRNYEGISKPDPSKPDDGVRTIFVKGKHMEKAVKDAILAAGGGFLAPGGWIEITYTGDDMSSKAASKPKFFAVRYQPPAPGSVPAQQNQQQAAPAHQGYSGQGYPAQPAQQVAPAWQQPGWNPQQNVQGVPGGFAGPGNHAPAPVAPWPPQAPYPGATHVPAQAAVPSHHGSPEQIPEWAKADGMNPLTPAMPTSAAPAPTSAPPAPALSTLELIAQAQQAVSGASDWSDPGQVQPVF